MNLYSAFCLHSPGLGPTRAARTLASPGFRINASQIRAFLQVAMPTGEREVVMLLRATVLRSVLRKVFDLSAHGITRPLAESILALDFPEEDAARIDELNAKANEGTLTDEEEAELDAYVNISDLLAYWQSKARQALQ